MLKLTCLILAMSGAAAAQQYRAFWADAFHEGYKTPAQVDRLIEDVRTARANAIFLETRVRSNSYFRQSVEPFAEDAAVPAGFDPLEYTIQKAHAAGIEVHAWAVVYPLWRTGAAPLNGEHLYYKHGPPAQGAERWLNQTSAGVETLALDPGHPGVLPYLVEAILDPARHYDIDGIHLDYVRYPEGADYGYNDHAIERFNRQAGRGGRPAVRESAWSQWKRDQVTALVRQLYLRMQQMRPKLKLSVAAITWGNGPATDTEYRGKDAYGYVFQDWRGWLEEGIVDFTMPMNYFDETRYAAYLTKWSEYQKSRQYGRGMVNGLANYLNTVPNTLAQLDRVLAPSSEGALPLGVSFYSYASTRSDDATQRPNAEFYARVGEYFKEDARIPELAWKVRPEKGHLLGRVEMEGGEAAWVDGMTARLVGRAGEPKERKTDVAGFYGWVDLAPGDYMVEVAVNGRVVGRTEWAAVEAGKAVEVKARVRGEDVESALPRLAGGQSEAAPGEVVRLAGALLADAAGWAESVPLPKALAGTMVVINGQAAPLFEIGEEFVTVQMPYASAEGWELKARRAGFESRALKLGWVAARPRIVEVNRQAAGMVEIVATGLGMAAGAAAGQAAGAEANVAAAVKVVLAGGREIDAEAAVLDAWTPGRYLVRAKVEEGASLAGVRLRAGEAISGPFE